MKHTEGKWEFIQKKNSNGQYNECYLGTIQQVGGLEYEVAAIWDDVESKHQAIANAKLIASAPILLEALKECRDTLVLLTLLDKSNATTNSIAIADNAIKQATE
jgi:hypothetical protein